MSALSHSVVERTTLAASTLQERGRLRLRVWGASMLPTLWPGDVVEVAGCPLTEIRPGEIVLAIRDGRLYLHRVRAVTSPGDFVLRGDSMPGSDPPYSAGALLGKVNRVERSGRTVVLRSCLRLHTRAFGWLFCYSGLARRIALRLHQREIAEVRSQTGKVNAELRAATCEPQADRLLEARGS